MRGWRIGLAGVSLAAAAGGVLAACAQAEPLSAADCRRVWDGLRQTQAEDGPIAPQGSATAARWQEEYDVAERRAKRPGNLDTCAQDVVDAGIRFAALVDLGSKVQTYDLAAQLETAERDLRHARDLGGLAVVPPRLERAFRELRAAAPEVSAAVSEVEQGAAELDLEDRGAVRDLAAEIEDAATGVPAYDGARRALEVIGGYELGEE